MRGGVRHPHAEIHMMASDDKELAVNDKTVVNASSFAACARAQMLLFQMVGYVAFIVARLLVLCQILRLL